MRGDFTRSTFRKMKHYSGVRMQQGRVQLDADWNEQLDILSHLDVSTRIDVIGRTGAPHVNSGFELLDMLNGAQPEFVLAPGHFYVDGVLVEAESAWMPAQLTAADAVQVGDLIFDDRTLQTGEVIELVSDDEDAVLALISNINRNTRTLTLDAPNLNQFQGDATLRIRRMVTYRTQPTPPQLLESLSNGLYLMYLHSWQRDVTVRQDPTLREVALSGVDTTTRTQTAWQIELERMGASTGGNPSEIADEMNAICDAAQNPTCAPNQNYGFYTCSTARLKARSNPEAALADPCYTPQSGGYTRLDNQLYRVEVHTGGNAGSTTIKWSRENASVAFQIQSIQANVVTLYDMGRDDRLGLNIDDIIELRGDDTDFGRGDTILRRITDIDPDRSEITLSGAQLVDGVSITTVEELLGNNPIALRWDYKQESAPHTLQITEGTWQTLEDGVQIFFENGGTYRAGDYWLIPARSLTGDVLWAQSTPVADEAPEALFEYAQNQQHGYAPLAVVRVAGGVVEDVLDCRQKFPPLTDIGAVDVRYDPSEDVPELHHVDNVQDAIDALAHIRIDGCTIRPIPNDENWETVFDSLEEGQDASICFREGEYIVDEPIVIMNAGHLKLSGNGFGSRVIARSNTTAFIFVNCKSVTIRDMTFETLKSYVDVPSTDENTNNMNHFNGIVTLRDCNRVLVDAVNFLSSSAIESNGACLRVNNRNAQNGTVTIQNSRFRVGHQQVGILLTEASGVRIMNNILTTNPYVPSLVSSLQNVHYRAGVRNLLIRDFIPNIDDELLVGIAAEFALLNAPYDGGGLLVLVTEPSLTDAWETLYEEHEPKGAQNMRDLMQYVRRMADNLLANGGRYNYSVGDDERTRSLSAFTSWYRNLEQSHVSAMGQGIVVAAASRSIEDIVIQGNTIKGARIGIHVAANDNDSEANFTVRKVTIRDNKIDNVASAYARARHGIFVGNGNSITIENNNLAIQRLPVTGTLPVSAIKAIGRLGRVVHINKNNMQGYSTAIEFEKTDTLDANQQQMWAIGDNFAPNTSSLVKTPSVQRSKMRGLSTNLA